MQFRFRLFLVLYRYLNHIHKSILLSAISFPVIFIYKIYSNIIGIDISHKTSIGKGLIIDHGFGLVVHYKSQIGANVRLRNGVTIGVKHEHSDKVPFIGDNVTIGANSVLLGPIVIGNNVVIGAGSVVLSSIPDNEMWAGVPARRIK